MISVTYWGDKVSPLKKLVHKFAKISLMRKLILLLLFTSFSAKAYVDLNISYSFTKRKIEGIEDELSNEDPGEAVTTTSGVSVTWAWYIWEYTALELNYSSSDERLTDNRETATSDSTITIKEIDSLVRTQVSGVGIRQSFASRKARIVPSLSIGYAQLTTSGETTYVLDNSGAEERLTIEKDKEVNNSGYVTFQLRFRLTQLMGLTLAAKSVMPDFDTEQAENNLIYSAGFSWAF